MKALLRSIGLSSLLVATAAFAHHGWSEYDSSKSMQLNGTIEESGYSHPHGLLRLKNSRQDVDHRSGPSIAHGEPWAVEGHAECRYDGYGGRLSESKQTRRTASGTHHHRR